MPTLTNLTPFAATAQAHVDAAGNPRQLVIAKGVWRLDTQQLADRPGPLGLHLSPVMRTLRQLRLDAAQRCVVAHRLDQQLEWFPADLGPPKPMFDFLVCGYAHAPKRVAQARFQASIAWDGASVGAPPGEMRHIVWAHGPRYWEATLLGGGGAVPGPAIAEVHRVPVHPIFAFGGIGWRGAELFHPSGMGGLGGGDSPTKVAMPWLELHGHLLSARHSAPQPTAFGPWPENARHRQMHAGTRDKTWQQQRAPLPPTDFNPRYHNLADPALQWPRAPAANTPITLHNLSERGLDRIQWPAAQPRLSTPDGATHPMVADTCVVSPEDQLYAIVWRALLMPDADATVRVATR